MEISPELRSQFVDLYRILSALRNHDISPALECVYIYVTERFLKLISNDNRWSMKNRPFLKSRSSPLEFYLHRSQYIRILLASEPPDKVLAVSYANATLRPFHLEHKAEFQRLMTCILFLPEEKLRTSPYADLASPSVHADLEPLFAKEYCASLGMSRQVPLRVVGDIGGGGALARIEKGRKVMRERKSEWSQTDELPVSNQL